MMNNERSTRRGFLRLLGGALTASLGTAVGAASGVTAAMTGGMAGAANGATGPGPRPGFGGRVAEHPEPRPDVDGSNVLTADDLGGNPDLVPLFEGIAKIPQIADGIGCTCGCASDPNIRSLLSCYEKTSRMAMFCEICQAEGRMVVRLHERGRTLDQIRAALDARFG